MSTEFPPLETDLAEARIGHSDLFWQHDGHLNETGNRLFASALAEALGEVWR